MNNTISIKKLDIKRKSLNYNCTIKTGLVLYVKYLLLKEDEIKVSNFIGLCVTTKKKSNTFVLKNNIKKENIKLVLNGQSPLIISVKILKKYKKKFRLSKLYYK